MTDRNKINEILYDELFKNQDFTAPSDKLDDFIMKLAATAIAEAYAEILEEYEDTIRNFKEIELNTIIEKRLQWCNQLRSIFKWHSLKSFSLHTHTLAPLFA